MVRMGELPSTGEVRLPAGYVPHPFDVITRKGRDNIAHAGNTRFRLCVEMRVDRYVQAKNRYEKTMILREIIETVRISGGRFIRQHDLSDKANLVSSHCAQERVCDEIKSDAEPIYYEIGRKKAADKAGHAMRLALSKQVEAKSKRRKSWPVGNSCPHTQKTPTQNAGENLQSKSALPRYRKLMDSSSVVSFDHEEEVTETSHLVLGLTETVHRSSDNESSVIYPNQILSNYSNFFSSARSSRRQSWHAGSILDYQTLAMNESSDDGVCLTSGDESLSSTAWDLNNLQNQQGDETDTCSFGTISTGECDFDDFNMEIQPFKITSLNHSGTDHDQDYGDGDSFLSVDGY